MTERKVLVTEEYHPKGRTVIVDDIPAVEVTMAGEARVLFDADVFDRVYLLVDRALGGSDAAELRIRFSAADAAVSGG